MMADQTYDLVEYVRQNANTDFSEMGFNAADALVLAELAYIKWDELGIPYPGDGTMTLAEAISWLPKEVMDGQKQWFYDLLQLVKGSERFGSMIVSNYFSISTREDEANSHTELEQFSAIVFTYTDENGETVNYVSYRGTDGTLEGWCEDFNMAYDSMTEAQRRAAEYLNNIAQYLDGSIQLGGHSKGGNDAMYAYLFCNEEIRERIIKIFTFDGPGFIYDLNYEDRLGNVKYVDSQIWAQMVELLKDSAICPYDSVIGQLLDEVEYVFVDTDGAILLDHDAFLWHIDPVTGEFTPRDQSPISKYVNELMDEWIHKLPVEYRKTFMNTVWGWIYTLDVEHLDDVFARVKQDWKSAAVDLLDYISSMPQQEREVFLESLMVLVLLAADNGLEEVMPGYETLRQKVDEVLQPRKISTAKELWLYLSQDPLDNTMDLLQAILCDWETLKALAQSTAAVAVTMTLVKGAVHLLSLAAGFVAAHMPMVAAIVAALVVVGMAINYIHEHWDELMAWVSLTAELVARKLEEFFAAMRLAIRTGAQVAVTGLVALASQVAEDLYQIGCGLVSIIVELGRLTGSAIVQAIAISNPLLYTLIRTAANVVQSAVSIDMVRLQSAVDAMIRLAERVASIDTRLDSLYQKLCISNIQQGEGIFTSLANLYNLCSADILVDKGFWIRKKANDLSALFDAYKDAEDWTMEQVW